jgi:hypothetical protein
MKTYSKFLVFSVLATVLPSQADIFKMKDGSTLEGTIVSQEGDSYVLDVQITKSIKDTRTVAKADVLKIERDEPDAKAFEALKNLVPPPDFMTADECMIRMAALEKFLKAYPGGSNSKRAKEMLETLKAESKLLAAGGIRFNGEMLTAAEYQANAYDLDARVQEVKIRRLIEEGRNLAALRAFSEFDQKFRSSTAYAGVVSAIKPVIQAQLGEARQTLATFDERVKQRQAGLQQMSASDRPVTESAIAEENAAMEAAFAAEKAAKVTWPTTNPFHKASLEETVRFGQAELTRLAAPAVPSGVDGGRAYREAYQAVHQGTLPAATAALAAAKAALVSPVYLAPLEELAKAKK